MKWSYELTLTEIITFVLDIRVYTNSLREHFCFICSSSRFKVDSWGNYYNSLCMLTKLTKFFVCTHTMSHDMRIWLASGKLNKLSSFLSLAILCWIVNSEFTLQLVYGTQKKKLCQCLVTFNSNTRLSTHRCYTLPKAQI